MPKAKNTPVETVQLKFSPNTSNPTVWDAAMLNSAEENLVCLNETSESSK